MCPHHLILEWEQQIFKSFPHPSPQNLLSTEPVITCKSDHLSPRPWKLIMKVPRSSDCRPNSFSGFIRRLSSHFYPYSAHIWAMPFYLQLPNYVLWRYFFFPHKPLLYLEWLLILIYNTIQSIRCTQSMPLILIAAQWVYLHHSTYYIVL